MRWELVVEALGPTSDKIDWSINASYILGFLPSSSTLYYMNLGQNVLTFESDTSCFIMGLDMIKKSFRYYMSIFDTIKRYLWKEEMILFGLDPVWWHFLQCPSYKENLQFDRETNIPSQVTTRNTNLHRTSTKENSVMSLSTDPIRRQKTIRFIFSMDMKL